MWVIGLQWSNWSNPSNSETFTEQSHCWWQIEKTSCWNKGTRVWEKSSSQEKRIVLTSHATHVPWNLHPSECLWHLLYFASTMNPICIKASWKVETWALGQPFVSSGQPRQQRQQLLCQETYPALEASSRLQRPLALRLEPCDIPIFLQTRINKSLFFVQNALTETWSKWIVNDLSESSRFNLFVKQNCSLGLQRLYGKVVVKYVVILTGTCLLSGSNSSQTRCTKKRLGAPSHSRREKMSCPRASLLCFRRALSHWVLKDLKVMNKSDVCSKFSFTIFHRYVSICR